jgi:hypothetical protein
MKTLLTGADIEVTDNNKIIYSTPGYGGTDPFTDNTGQILSILVMDRWYYHSNLPIEFQTKVKVKMVEGLNWEEKRENVDMSLSHHEVFFVSNNITPSIPAGIKITRLQDTNSLNISWDPVMNTNKYTIHKLISGTWEIIQTVYHPQTWTFDEDLQDES